MAAFAIQDLVVYSVRRSSGFSSILHMIAQGYLIIPAQRAEISLKDPSLIQDNPGPLKEKDCPVHLVHLWKLSTRSKPIGNSSGLSSKSRFC